MKNISNSLAYLCIIFLSLFISSCSETASLEDPNEVELAKLNELILNSALDTTTNIIQGTAASSDTWKSWDDAYFSCFRDQTFKKNRIYLGPSNTKYLGVILSKDKSTARRNLQSIIPPSDFTTFIIQGAPVNTCDLTKIKDVSLDLMLSATFAQMDDSLKSAINNYDSIKIVGGEWQVDELVIDDFLDYINSSSDNKVKAYKKSLLESNNYLLTKVVKVSGFAAEIYSTRNFGVGVSAQLQQGKTLDIVSPGVTNAAFKLNLGIKSDKVVKVSSSGQFYIYGVIQKGKKL
jgi:hypothetical protein